MQIPDISLPQFSCNFPVISPQCFSQCQFPIPGFGLGKLGLRNFFCLSYSKTFEGGSFSLFGLLASNPARCRYGSVGSLRTPPAASLVDTLNDIFTFFDRLCLLHGVEKIKTIAGVGIDGHAAKWHFGFSRQMNTTSHTASMTRDNCACSWQCRRCRCHPGDAYMFAGFPANDEPANEAAVAVVHVAVGMVRAARPLTARRSLEVLTGFL